MAELDKQQLKDNMKSGKQWLRILHMVLFCLLLACTASVLGLLVIIQVLFALVTGLANENITKVNADLIRYINQILLFLTYNEDRKPFPFSSWGTLQAEQAPQDTADSDDDSNESKKIN